ncbi:MAG: hypothetical protein M1812_007732 [Candelaria pacifica]|nr:MAG: hypothetical protein M1812_007732 [Candelaria pacifica]
MPPTKKRKVTRIEKRKSPLPKQQHRIQSFGTISKAQALPDASTAKLNNDLVTVPALTLKKEPVGINSNKRKFATIEDECDAEVLGEEEKLLLLQELSAKASDSVCQSALVEPAVQARAVEEVPANVDELGSNNGRDQQPQSSLPPAILSSSPCRTGVKLVSSHVVPNELESLDDRALELPEELQDMVNLHSAFLTALSLHYAHNGSLTPADLRLLSPSIERSWGKRKVNVDDIRRLLGVLDMPVGGGSRGPPVPSKCAFRLSSYGGGKVCVEMRESSQKRGIMVGHVEENKLNAQFLGNMKRYWLHRNGLFARANCDEGRSTLEVSVQESINLRVYADLVNEDCIANFISKLPMAPITVCSSLAKISPTLAKGQRRLADLKAGAIKGKENSMKRQVVTTVCPSTKAPKDRGQGLIERIRAKELHQSTLPLPPSKTSLGRSSAFQRLEEVIQVLIVLTSSKNGSGIGGKSVGQRTSFTLPALLQILQSSLRNPISSEEAELCMRLLAQEVAPGWITVAVMSGVTGVVVQKGRRPDLLEIQARIKRCMQ